MEAQHQTLTSIIWGIRGVQSLSIDRYRYDRYPTGYICIYIYRSSTGLFLWQTLAKRKQRIQDFTRDFKSKLQEHIFHKTIQHSIVHFTFEKECVESATSCIFPQLGHITCTVAQNPTTTGALPLVLYAVVTILPSEQGILHFHSALDPQIT